MFRRCYATFKIANEQLMTLYRFSTTIFAGPSHVFGFNNNFAFNHYKAEPAEAPSGSVGLVGFHTRPYQSIDAYRQAVERERDN